MPGKTKVKSDKPRTKRTSTKKRVKKSEPVVETTPEVVKVPGFFTWICSLFGKK